MQNPLHPEAVDRIVVTKCASPRNGADYSLTIAGPEMKRLLDSLTALKRPGDSSSSLSVSEHAEWELQCYSGSNVLATAAFSRSVFYCDQIEYDAPRELRRLYHRVTKESRGKG
jgi:hypothetical protein